MKIPPLTELEDDLRIALMLKAEDILLTVGGEEGYRLSADFLGVPQFDCLPSDYFSGDESRNGIDLGRFAIAAQVKDLHSMLVARALSFEGRSGVPDPEEADHSLVQMLEQFLHALPAIALGGLDFTSVRSRSLRDLWRAGSAWVSLLEAVQEPFYGKIPDYDLRVPDLALLADMEVRSLRNMVGPNKLLRSTAERQLAKQATSMAGPTFVYVNVLDAIDWLVGRRGFSITPIAPQWAAKRLGELSAKPAACAAIVMGWINVGTSAELAKRLGWTVEKVRHWAENGPTGEADARSLAGLLNLPGEVLAEACERQPESDI